MKLYKVAAEIIESPKTGPTHTVSTGFGSRAAAERFATGLAAAGKCTWCSIGSYDDEEES